MNAQINKLQNNTLVSSDNKGMAAYLYECMSFISLYNISEINIDEITQRRSNRTVRLEMQPLLLVSLNVRNPFGRFRGSDVLSSTTANVGDTSPNTSVSISGLILD